MIYILKINFKKGPWDSKCLYATVGPFLSLGPHLLLCAISQKVLGTVNVLIYSYCPFCYSRILSPISA